MKLTQNPKSILEVIISLISSHKHSPSVQINEINITSTTQGYLERMKQRGYMDWESGKPRTLTIVQEDGTDGTQTA